MSEIREVQFHSAVHIGGLSGAPVLTARSADGRVTLEGGTVVVRVPGKEPTLVPLANVRWYTLVPEPPPLPVKPQPHHVTKPVKR